MNRAFTASQKLMVLIAALLVLTVLFLIPGVAPQFLTHWQVSTGFKQLTGYTLVALFTFSVLLLTIKRRLKKPPAMAKLLTFHQYAGAAILGLLLLHGGSAHQGYLTLVTWLVVGTSLAGLGLMSTENTWFASRKSTLLAIHILTGFVLCGLALMHLYFVYGYSR